MEDDFEKLKNFIDKKGNSFSEDITKSIIDICLDTEKIDLSLQISKQFKLTEEYLKIMITKLNKYDEALDIIENPEKNQFQIETKDKIDLYYKFSNYFLSKENFDQKFFSSVSKFIENNAIGIEKKDLNKLIDIFIEYDKFFKILFEKIGTLQLNYEKNMIHKRIELYIQDGLEDNKNNILQIIRNEKFVEKYDTQYLIMLFKYYNFKEGLEVLYEVNKINQDLLMIYIEKKEYKKIISLCEKYGMVNISLWWRSLEFFLGKEFRKDLIEEEKNQLNIFFEEFLMKLLESDTLIDLNILEYINDINNDIPLSLINNFLTKAFERHYTLLSDQEKNFQEYDKEINTTLDEIKEIRTKGYILDFKECNECSLPLSLPFISFNCGHVYHNLCFYSHFTSGGKKFCRKCKEKKDKIEGEYKKIKTDGEKFNDINKLENEIGKNKDKVDFMHQLYGKGIINISPITDEDIASKNINFNK
jgi:hypothetical protein